MYRARAFTADKGVYSYALFFHTTKNEQALKTNSSFILLKECHILAQFNRSQIFASAVSHRQIGDAHFGSVLVAVNLHFVLFPRFEIADYRFNHCFDFRRMAGVNASA